MTFRFRLIGYFLVWVTEWRSEKGNPSSSSDNNFSSVIVIFFSWLHRTRFCSKIDINSVCSKRDLAKNVMNVSKMDMKGTAPTKPG